MFAAGENIILRQFGKKDLNSFFEYRSDPVVCRFQEFMLISKGEAAQFIEKQTHAVMGTPGQWFQVAIALLESDELIGDCGVMFDAHDARLVEIGYTLNPRFQFKGFAHEAVSLLCQLLFDNYNVHKIKAVVDIRNSPSIRLAERVGFIQEGHLQQSYWDNKTGQWYDELLYGMLSER
jgi:RimJ/RimL family protein N-acetyltransferase